MDIRVSFFLIHVSMCIIVRNPIVWKKPQTVEKIENGSYADFVNLNLVSELISSGNIVYDMSDFQYAQKLTVGEPQQEFLAWISTGVSMLWIPHNNCTAPACKTKNKFEPEKSSTFKPTSTEFKIRCYGGVVTGVYGTDQIQIGGIDEEQLTLPKAMFGLAKNLTDAFEKAEFDGMIGLAFYGTDGAKSKPFIMSLIDQGYLDKPIFTVWFAQQGIESGKAGGMITYGDFDTENCGNVFGYEILSSPYYYQYKINSVSMGNFSYPKRVDVTQGFGTWIAGPKPIIDRFAQDVGAQYNQNGLYDIDCKARVPPLFIVADANKFKIESENLIIRVNNRKCLLGFLPMGSSTFGPSWHMGAAFTRQYCTIFDIGEGRIGFADSIRKNIEVTTKRTTKPTTKSSARFSSSTAQTSPTTSYELRRTTTPNAASIWLYSAFVALLSAMSHLI